MRRRMDGLTNQQLTNGGMEQPRASPSLLGLGARPAHTCLVVGANTALQGPTDDGFWDKPGPQTKRHWDTAMPMRLHTVCGGFQAVSAERPLERPARGPRNPNKRSSGPLQTTRADHCPPVWTDPN